MASVRIIEGDCRDGLRSLAPESVDAVLTSPPYWGLRTDPHGGIGLEPTLAEHLAALVDVFRLIRPALKSHGAVWLNYGEVYASSVNGRLAALSAAFDDRTFRDKPISTVSLADGIKPKDMTGAAWRLAFALQADGWFLRQCLIWAKPNPMPSSVKDRFCLSHEYWFLLAKQSRYYFDTINTMEPTKTNDTRRPYGSRGMWQVDGRPEEQQHGGEQREPSPTAGKLRYRRSVWEVPIAAFPGHAATFPPKLIEPLIISICPPGGTILDPFGGAGTTGMVAARTGRDAILIEKAPEFCQLAAERIRDDYDQYIVGRYRQHAERERQRQAARDLLQQEAQISAENIHRLRDAVLCGPEITGCDPI